MKRITCAIVLIVVLTGLSSCLISSDERYGLERVGSARVGVGYRVFVDGDLAYLTHNDGASIVDVSDPQSPMELAVIETPEASFGIFAADGMAYVLAAGVGMKIVDVSNPAQPVTLGSINPGGILAGIVVEGNYAYVADRDRGFHIIDVSNAAHPVKVNGAYTQASRVEDVAKQGDIIYLACPESGVHVVDVSDPASPRWVTTLPGTSGSNGVAIDSNNVLAVACYSRGVRVFDAANSEVPRYAGRFTGGHEAQKVSITSDYIAVAYNMDGLRLFGLNERLELIEIGQYKTGSATHDVFCDDEYIYLADGAAGLLILKALEEAGQDGD